MKNRIEVVTDTEDPLLLRFFLNGRECLSGTFLETKLASGTWIPCHFLYDETFDYTGQNVRIPRVLIWLDSIETLPVHDDDQPPRIAAQIHGNPLDAFYRWTTPDGGGQA